ncbi:MAG: nucleotidyl transferase AbiEii/AbiGii toxin family protein [Planctomycetota bacterium]|nr:nucleotidyl transferase AbiEii/AbiGii toxin family protein [Planctomycetota bacterium]
MDDFARMRAADRVDLFQRVANNRGLNPAIIEKDFWVCWTLNRLFTLPKFPGGLLFKGGTSLSKVFNAIERFSEDIDLSFDRSGLGFGGENDPLVGRTGKQRKHRVEALIEASRRMIREQLLPELGESFRTALDQRSGGAEAWSVELAADDLDGQTILFHYPASILPHSANEPAYIRPVVRLELGARSDHWPTIEGSVTPYAAEDFPGVFRTPSCRLKVLSAERTFWEKATVLHTWYHAPEDKAFRDRQSRHYYDVARLYEKGIGKEAMKNIDLLLKVAQHKEVFFASSWAKYREARPGTLRLLPRPSRLDELKRDFEIMREMIFGQPQSFDHVLEVLREIELQVNGKSEVE